ncbi:MAG: amidase [Pseudohongiellaceae bacterium]
MDRRKFIKNSSILALGVGAIGNAPSGFAASLPANIIDFTATQLSQAIRLSNVSCVETMQAYLAHIDRFNPTYNAIVGRVESDNLLNLAREADADIAGGNYRGWMHGFPHAVKDLAPVKGLIFTSGSPMFADRVADQDSAMVKRMRDSGAIFIGKTNTPEFGLGSQSYNPVFGATGSAYDPALTAGGSSGGAASGLGTHMLPVADGSDMMGSLRNPGAFNNVIGFRPSTGLMGGSDPFSRSLATAGPMARNTEDLIGLLHVIASEPNQEQAHALHSALPGPEYFVPEDLKRSKIAWLGDCGGYLAMEDGILDLCESSLQQVSASGASVEPTLPEFDLSELWQAWLTLRNWSRISYRDYYENSDTRAQLKPELIWEIERSYELSVEDIYRANQIRSRWYAELNRLFTLHDFIALPTAQVFPFAKELHWPNEINGQKMDTYHRWMESVIMGSLSGLPIVNVPVGFDDRGRPMGMQIMGRYGDDKRVLEFALAYENVTSHLQRRPTLVPA